MTDLPETLIVGPGAVGQVLAAKAPVRVLLLARTPAQERRLEKAGAGLSVRRRKTPVGLAFFCVKARDLERAVSAASPWVGPDTAVVGLQNGIAHGETLRRRFGLRRTVAGNCYFAASRAGDLASHTGGSRIMLAETRANREAARRAADWLGRSWTVELVKDERRMLWTKLCFNAATNPLGALCRATNGELAADPALEAVMSAALAEGLRAARRRGARPVIADLEAFLKKACAAAPGQRNSMLQDIESGRPTERREILGPILAAGPAPVLSALDRWLKSLEASLGR